MGNDDLNVLARKNGDLPVVYGNSGDNIFTVTEETSEFTYGAVLVAVRTPKRTYGAGGDDTYQLKELGFEIIELAGNGIDTLELYGLPLNELLPKNLETLRLMEKEGGGTTWNSRGIGNNADNIIIGKSGHNTINSKGGDDILTAGMGPLVLSLILVKKV
jgi:hypothetical protein